MLSTLLLLCAQDAPVVTSMRASAAQVGNPLIRRKEEALRFVLKTKRK